MVNRVMQENATLRTTFETRLGILEQFRAQALVLGGIGFILLGATASAVLFKVLGAP